MGDCVHGYDILPVSTVMTANSDSYVKEHLIEVLRAFLRHRTPLYLPTQFGEDPIKKR